MNKKVTFLALIALLTIACLSFDQPKKTSAYQENYLKELHDFKEVQQTLLNTIQQSDLQKTADITVIKKQIQLCRNQMKGMDFWFRYLDPISYKKINGPLPVEWETEVFEKFEKPYKREGAGLTLAYLYLEEDNINKDTLSALITKSYQNTSNYYADSVVNPLQEYHHFFLCNRLYLLNLAAIYTTGFECPDTSNIIPELRLMMTKVLAIYTSYNANFKEQQLTNDYLALYNRALNFVNNQPTDYTAFDHYTFISEYVNPLFAISQKLINDYHVFSKSMVDYTLNKSAESIFSKDLYRGQNSKGIFLRVKDSAALAMIEQVGKQLFFDPILSGNNKRSCASCHKTALYFTDTTGSTNLQFDAINYLPRNTPSLVNAGYNHLIMLDGKHISLQHQVLDVITNKKEMGCEAKDALDKVLSCADYKNIFTKLLNFTPQEDEITLEHIASAITYYYGKFSQVSSPFDQAMNRQQVLNHEAKEGFNLFMSKAQCGTCHFVPQFNGVKPPYVSSEFEVLGVPADTGFRKLSEDKGRFVVNPAAEMNGAFRTGTIRNAAFTAPYMHNGIFKNLDQVIEFYNHGGGAGRGLSVSNQTLSSDSLHISIGEKRKLIAFINSLNEPIPLEIAPKQLPHSSLAILNQRKVGGTY